MAKPAAVPVTLHIGSSIADLGAVDLPLIATPAGRDAAGLWHVDFHVDHAEFRHGIAELLRSAADEFDKGATDGG
ncbi:hypothetical protein ACBJ59_10640 [Nonomuraea sp. MTCD27]|uniref:hypothetical protein n=1 Tax=Nonomuraea sp. MTCD27 TaxID=1676747 RepID=UPI0035C1AB4A